MRISVIGTGYVGLVTGVGLASAGHQVTCVDSDEAKIRRVSQGVSPLYEKGLDQLLAEVLRLGRFSATSSLAEAVLASQVTFICVGTPLAPDGGIDLSQVRMATGQIGSALRLKRDYHLVVVKSTVIPGTCSEVVLPLLRQSLDGDTGRLGLCMNPEFLREGNAVEDFMNPDRIIIGELDKASGDILEEAYCRFEVPILRTTFETAEMIKYTSNALLGTLISFSNEVAGICEMIRNVDVNEVLRGIHLDKRLNPRVGAKLLEPQILTYLIAGCGFGGSCLPKDIGALLSFSRAKGYEPRILSSVLGVNEGQPVHLVDLADRELGGLVAKKVAVLGLAFKPDTDDVRNSPAIPVVTELVRRRANVSVYDPHAIENARTLFEDLPLEFCSSVEQAISRADACILVTRCDEFKHITPDLLRENMKRPLLIDGRRFLRAEDFAGKARYLGIGLYPGDSAPRQ